MSKRQASTMNLAMVADKRAKKHDENDVTTSLELYTKQIKKHSMKGSTMLLTGHDGEIFTAKFHPNSSVIASAGSDRSIFLWSTREDCENYAILRAAHSHTILDLQYSADGDYIFSCAADKKVIVWDSASGCRLKKLHRHNSYVNALAAASNNRNLFASVGDDRKVYVWDLRARKAQSTEFTENYQVTAVAFNKSGDQVMVGGIENTINVWDLRHGKMIYKLSGHMDTITGLSLSPDGNHVLSNAMDNTLKCWDARPYAPENRLEKTFLGHQHNFEKNLLRCAWSPNQDQVTAGSSDGLVYIWDYNSCDIVHRLPGHRSSVNEVVFSPGESIVMSCSSDRQIYLGEINHGAT